MPVAFALPNLVASKLELLNVSTMSMPSVSTMSMPRAHPGPFLVERGEGEKSGSAWIRSGKFQPQIDVEGMVGKNGRVGKTNYFLQPV